MPPKTYEAKHKHKSHEVIDAPADDDGTAGAVHDSVKLVVVWCVDFTPVTSAGAVDWFSIGLLSPSPAALSALTTYEYCVPPVSPDNLAPSAPVLL